MSTNEMQKLADELMRSAAVDEPLQRAAVMQRVATALRTAAQKQEPVAWLETFYEEGGGRETKVWLVEPKYDESTVSIVPLYANPPAPSEPQAATEPNLSRSITGEMVTEACEIYAEIYHNDDKDMGDAMRAALGAVLRLAPQAARSTGEGENQQPLGITGGALGSFQPHVAINQDAMDAEAARRSVQAAPTREETAKHERVIRQFFADGRDRFRSEKALDAILALTKPAQREG